MRVFVTGDTHADLDINKLVIFNAMNPELTKEDLVIVCGDFGVVWNKINEELIDVYEEFHFSTAFVLGNHEGYDTLEILPEESWNGGIVRRLSDSIVQLMNGNTYEICGHTFLVMGGGTSIDKDWRIPHESWWPQEIPNQKQRDLCMRSVHDLKLKGIKPIVLTHTAPSNMIKTIHANFKLDEYTDFLQQLYDNLDFTYWYCGHFHEDISFKSLNFRFLYNDIVELDFQ